ncbi:retrovirus-related pol polyprotein from transposon TNT 1-94 [Tanacetum coccineum]
MTTLAEYIIVVGADNRHPMLEKSRYDSWASRIRLFIKGKKHGRMMLDPNDNGPLVYPTVEENRQTRPKKYSKLTEAQQLQDDCDVQATNIILHGLPPDVYALVNHQEVAKDIWDRFLNALLSEWSKFVTDVKLAKSLYTTNYDQLYAYLSQHEQHANEVRITRERYPDPLALVANSPTLYNPSQSPQHSANPGLSEAPVAQQIIPQNSAFQTEDLDAYDSDCDDLSSAKAVLMANLSSCDSDVLSEESQDAVIQDTNSSAPNNLLVLSLVEQMTDHVAHLDKENQTNKMVNESLTAELERYKERVAIFEQRLNVDLNKHEKLIDSQMDDLIRNRNAKLTAFQQEIDTLKETLSNHVKEKESLSKTLIVFKTESKEKESKYIDKEIVLEKQNKKLVNIISQQIQPTLYDGSVIAKEHTVIFEIDDKETLILKEESRSKMLDQQNDPISIEKKIKISPIDYSKLNKIKEDFEIVHIAMNSVDNLDVKESCVNDYNKCLELETELLKKKDLIEKDVYDKLLKSYSTLEKHCISLELTTQLNQESVKEKDTLSKNVKDMIKSLSEKDSVENVKKDIDEIEMITLSWSITRVQSKEHCDSLIAQINATSVENSDLNAQLQEKELKGKNVIDTVISKPNATIAPGMSKLDIKPISHILKNNKDTHEVYLKKTIENTDTLRGLVECARKQNPSEPLFMILLLHVGGAKYLFRNWCPLTRITSIKVVTTKETSTKSVATPTQGILVYSRRPKAIRFVGSSSKVKIVESKTSNSKEPKQPWGSTVSDVPSSSLNDCRFGNDHIAKIMGYGDYQMRNVTISQVYYVEGLGHNLFSVGNFCDSDLEVAFRKHTYFIRDLDGVDTLEGSRGLVRGLPKLKYQKDHLCSAYTLPVLLVKFLRSKDEVPDFMIKFLKMLQVRLNATIRNIRTDNGTEFVNHTLKAYYEEVGISHQTSVARTL